MATTTFDTRSDSSAAGEERLSRPGWGVLLLGWVCVLFGLVLFGGGVYLIVLGGSWYYAIAGAGLIVTGILLNHGKVAALWIYLLIWAGTLVWSWWEVGADWWAQVPRMVAPTVILLLLLLCLPNIRRVQRRPL
ncbi:glucose dehydrogenase [Citreicella sp. C3M06]|uniref:glucose dehydrogenase n=1 Tax=Roseobacteraceae TaxID=2854170 RepID=UPI001C0891CD|nr:MULTISPECIES: glucose dehydrogenase [Roseobacteraceae]MBU2959782.1 glucose dehydrogenase [Citreicella sp. C3M06]MDO6584161.1 glucose dehydrogenase [Salipiger sp. 1_MG-2023]